MMFRRMVLAASCGLAAAGPLQGQCPDGSQPPCRGLVVASGVTRRDPPIDPKTWIVVPFDNLNNNADIDWLRTGAVNLLYLGMSRWTDIRVIDDERVADYMREVPGAVEAKSLSASQAIAIAKRAGAAQVVMGDVLKLGSRVTVNAKIFDVRTGQRQRSVREETNSVDSVMAVFSRLSQKVLNIPLPTGAAAGAVVTQSIAAYQEYAQGMAALNLFDLPGGQRHLTRALELDSTFALAHAKLSVLMGWVAPGSPAGRQHAEAASRLSGSLPPREQALIKASVAFARQDYSAACDGFSALIRNDSTDTDAWYGLGDCLYHDNAMLPTGSDSTHPRFRASRNASLRAFQQVLALDPTYHLAYQHIVDQYNSQFVAGARWCVTASECSAPIAVVRPSGDSLILSPLVMPRDTAIFRQHMDEYVRVNARRMLLDKGKAVGERWVAANPSEGRARLMYATVLNSLGSVRTADSVIALAVLTDSAQAAAAAAMLRLELSIKGWRPEAARALYDSMRAHTTNVGRGPNGQVTTGNVVVLVAPTFGRIAEFDSLVVAGIRASGAPLSRVLLSRMVIRAMLGAPADSLPAALRVVFDELSAQSSPAAATRGIGPYLGLWLRGPTDWWPQLDTTVRDLRAAPALAMQRKDTAALRRAARGLDSLSSTFIARLVPDTGSALVAAEAFIALKDSASALRMVRRWIDSSATYTAMVSGQTGGTFVQPLLLHAAVMRADLAAGLGYKEEARLWYDRVLNMWAKADPELQPLIERLRKSRAALSP